MENVDQLKEYIRFSLGRLTPNNSYHQFEHLCRNLAKIKVVNNIISATGPVSTSGDQGIDFQTYKTFLEKNKGDTSFFFGRSSFNEEIIFACSLQKNYKTKIKSDVKKIASIWEPDWIYFYSSQDIPIGELNILKTECQKTYNIQLEIIDGNGISEQLTDPEAFWIATEYLSIPKDFYPKSEEIETLGVITSLSNIIQTLDNLPIEIINKIEEILIKLNEHNLKTLQFNNDYASVYKNQLKSKLVILSLIVPEAIPSILSEYRISAVHEKKNDLLLKIKKAFEEIENAPNNLEDIINKSDFESSWILQRAIFLTANFWHMVGDYNRAARFYELLYDIYPVKNTDHEYSFDKKIFFFNLIHNSYYARNYENVIEQINDAMGIDIHFDPIISHIIKITKAFAFLQLGDNENSIEEFESLTDEFPIFACVEYHWGAALVNSGKIREGLLKFQNSLNIKPDYLPPIHHWGRVLIDRGQYEKAINKFDEILKIQPNNEEALIMLTKLYPGLWASAIMQKRDDRTKTSKIIKNKDIESMLEVIIKCEKLRLYEKIEKIETIMFMGETLAHFNYYKQALAIFKYIHSIDTENIDALINQGDMLDVLDRPDEAIEIYNRVIKLQPDSIKAIYRNGIVHRNKGDLIKSNNFFLKIAEIRPAIDDGFFEYGVNLMSMEKFDDSKIVFEKLLDNNPNDNSLQINLSIVYYNLDEYNKSINLLKNIALSVPDYSIVLYYWGLNLEKVGMHIESKIKLNQAFELDPKLKDFHTDPVNTGFLRFGTDNST